MGALSVELLKVNEDASIEPLKSWYEYENIDWDSNISEFIYMVDGVPVDPSSGTSSNSRGVSTRPHLIAS